MTVYILTVNFENNTVYHRRACAEAWALLHIGVISHKKAEAVYILNLRRNRYVTGLQYHASV